MILEHPELSAFEPLLDSLYPLVFEAGIEALQREGLLNKPEDLIPVIKRSVAAYRRFIRGCHYGWDLAQRRMVEHVIDNHGQILHIREALKADLRKRNLQEISHKKDLIACLEARQIVLRRLADTILYHLVKMQTWILRRVSLEYQIRDINPDTLRRTLEIATDLNRQERLNFHLLADLTTVVHVGDLVQVKFTSHPPEWSLIELKEGKMNSVLSDIIEKAGGGLTEEHIAEVREQFGAKAASQAKRMVRQQFRARELMKLINTDKGIDLLHETPIVLAPETVHVENYGETVRRLCEKARRAGFAIIAIDGCMRLLAMTREMYEKQGRMGVAHLLYHLQFGVTDCTLQRSNAEELKRFRDIYPFFDLTQMNLYAMWPPPICLWPMPKELVFDLLFGRTLVFGQLDYSKLFEMAHDRQIGMRWASDRELGEYRRMTAIIPGSPNAAAVRVELLDEPAADPQHLFIGFFSRMLLEFMSPSQFLDLVRAGFHQFGKEADSHA